MTNLKLIDEVVLPASEGSLGVLPGHAPLLTFLGAGELTWTRGGQVHHLEVPLDEIPLFVRGGAILPFGPAVQHTGELPGGTTVEYLEAYGPPRYGPCWA